MLCLQWSVEIGRCWSGSVKTATSGLFILASSGSML